VQAAAGPLYTAALLLVPEPPKQRQSTSSSSISASTPSALISAVLAELEAACKCLADKRTAGGGSSSCTAASKSDSSDSSQPQQGQDASTEQTNQQQQQQQQYSKQLCKLSQPQLLSVLLFDLVLLEAWASSSTPQEQQQQQQQPSSSEPAAMSQSTAYAVARYVVAALPGVAQSILSCMQQLLQAGPSPGLLADEDVSEQLLAVLQALLQLSAVPQHSLSVSDATTSSSKLCGLSAGAEPSAGLLLLEVLQLLVLTPAVPADTQSAAVALIPNLVLQQQQQQQQSSTLGAASLRIGASAGMWQQLLTVLGAAVGAASPAVRGAAMQAAAQLAQSVWLQEAAQHDNSIIATTSAVQQPGHGLFQHGAGTAAALTHLPGLLQLLMDRCSDLDVHVAAAAQQHTACLALPLHLLAAAGVSLEAASPSTVISSGGSGSGSSAWVSAAALQPQQRGFKPAQLAQLFEQQMHASPLLLQRKHVPSAAAAAAAGPAGTPSKDQQQQQQQQFMHWHAQAEGLYRLAQSLPVLPPGALGTTASFKSSSSSVPVVAFELLDSAAATAWLLLQEAARHCVNARLRTHLGNPMQSFNTLERMLHSMLHKLRADGSPAAAQRAWQQQLQKQLQKLLPQHQQHAAGDAEQHDGQQVEPQELLQTPAAAAGRSLSPYPAAVAAAAAAAASTGSSSTQRTSQLPSHQHQQLLQDSSLTQQALDALRTVEQQRAEAEAAAGSLLDFMLALEVNMHAAAEGSAVRPAVGKAVMAFFAGNKKVGLNLLLPLCRSHAV
jgi:hypothetical protein